MPGLTTPGSINGPQPPPKAEAQTTEHPRALGQLSMADGQTATTVTHGCATDRIGHVMIGTDTQGASRLGQGVTTDGQFAIGTDRQGDTVDGQGASRLGQGVTTDGQLTSSTERGLGTQLTAAFTSILPAPQAVFGTGPVCASLRAVRLEALPDLILRPVLVLLEHQRDRAGDVRRRHRGAAHRLVGVAGAVADHRRDDRLAGRGDGRGAAARRGSARGSRTTTGCRRPLPRVM